jgi:hypothetical protein
MEKVYRSVVAVDTVMYSVEFLICEAQAGGIADIEVREDLEVDFRGEGVEFWCWGGRVWIMLLASKIVGIGLEERKRGVVLTRHGCDRL